MQNLVFSSVINHFRLEILNMHNIIILFRFDKLLQVKSGCFIWRPLSLSELISY